MKIISFNWTLDPLLSGKKTVTRRFWKDRHAKLFKKDDIVKAYSKLPHAGGKPVAYIKLTCDPYKEHLYQITDVEEKKEGGLWGSAKKFITDICQKHKCDPKDMLWVVRFELVGIIESHPNGTPFVYPSPGDNDIIDG